MEKAFELALKNAREALNGVKPSEETPMLVIPFLQFCRHIAPLIAHLDGIFKLIAWDIMGNTMRLEKKRASNVDRFQSLRELVLDEDENFKHIKAIDPRKAINPIEDATLLRLCG
ncbi:hypothetical protein OROMI_021087 [Orobanche minor]